MSEQGVLSPDGSCKTFSSEANGYARGEAIVGVFVKPLEDAIREGNSIRAVIRATSTNHGGRSAGFTVPNQEAQEDVIRKAYQQAGFDMSETGYFECHGTGTPLGDPIETKAVANCFKKSGITIGSTKPNFGHTEGASGLLSLLKAVLMLENRAIPPSIKYLPRNRNIRWETGKLTLAEKSLPWPQDRRERVSVNSFGLGGSNAHAIVDSAVVCQTSSSVPLSGGDEAPQLLLYSANSQKSLDALSGAYASFLKEASVSVADVAYSLARGREYLKYRSFSVVRGNSIVTSPQALKPSSRTPKIVMVFTGQGAQWPGMANELLLSNETFRRSIQTLIDYLKTTLGNDAPDWTIEQELQRPPETSRLGLAEFSQPLCTAVQIALVDTLRSLGVDADAVVGHSSGEIAGAYIAGALSAGEAVITALYRGIAAKTQTKSGAMAALGMSVREAEEFLLPGTVIACDNSPRSVTISGDTKSVEEVLSSIRRTNPDIFVRKLAVDKAYHSHHMAEIGNAYNALLEHRIVVYWTRMPGLVPESPVLFTGAVSNLLGYFLDQEVILLEIGPHSALAGPLKQIMAATPNKATYIPTLIRSQDAVESLLSSVGKLFSLHVPLDVAALFPSGSCYNTAWLKHHRVDGDILFPFAGYIAIAGEAVRQVTKIEKAFRLRHVVVTTAMLLSEEEPTEIITTLRPLQLTVSEQSSWYEFTISAYNGSQWTKHCSGQVKAESGPLATGTSPEAYSRIVKGDRWFDAVSRQGLDLGQDFLNLSEITASTTKHEARCILSSKNYSSASLSPYRIHPAVIDGILQLTSVAAANGLTLKHRNFLPVSCDQLLVSRVTEDFVADVGVSRMGRESTSSRLFNGKGVLNGEEVLQFEGLEMRAARMAGENEETADPHAASRLIWAADIDFVDEQSLFKPPPGSTEHAKALQEVGELSIQRIHERLANIALETPHHHDYARWIGSRASSPDDLTHSHRSLDSLAADLVESDIRPIAQVLEAVTTNIDSILNGTPWESFLDHDVVANFRHLLPQIDSSPFFKALGHYKPNLRILEIASWSNSPSHATIKSLQANGHNLWSQYTFASETLLPSEERPAQYAGVEYVALDISRDLAAQGFQERQYDIIVVNGSLRRTQALGDSLHNIRSLLHPDGRLLVQGLCLPTDWVTVVLGSVPGYKFEDPDARNASLHADAACWQHKLETAGFGSIQTITFNSHEGLQSDAVLLARSNDVHTNGVSKNVTLLVSDKTESHPNIEKCLLQHGYKLTKVTLKDTPPPATNILSLLDLDGPFFENIADQDYQDFQTFLAKLQNAGTLWVTKPCHIRVRDPRYAQVIGLARVIRTELLIDFATCEVDDFDASLPLVCNVFDKFCNRNDHDALNPDFEFAIDNGIINISRYLPFTLADNFLQQEESERMKIVSGTPGRLSSLRWEHQPEPAALGTHEVEIEMHAVGLNCKDVLVGMNLIDHVGRYNGLEGAGIIRRVGTDVEDFQPGDRVVAMDHQMLSTLAITHENMCVKIPDSIEFMDAATMFNVYATVQQSLIRIGRLQKGESLLIHSACGGVGLAAIQIAQIIGAEIYATVGSDTKAQYLVDTFGIPRNRIFYSRDNFFVKDLYRETGGKGVDQVLNSLSGDLLHETWKCVAPHGKLIEIGKLRSTLPSLSIITDSPSRLMTETLEYLAKGVIKPIPIAKEFDASSVPDAFEHLLPGQHIGRVGIRIRDANGRLTVDPGTCSKASRQLHFNSTESYFLVGGLGGLGRAIATWMVELGARHLTFFGRSAGKSDDDQAFIKELKSIGVTVNTVRGSVTEIKDVTRAVEAAGPTLKGVLQLSTAQADDNFYAITKEQWDYSVGPKVNGTWNLHHATANLSLDFFVLASSLAAAVGMPGQANYAAGNSFLDAFVQYRSNLGLACSAIDIGAVADIGLLADKAALQRSAQLVGNKTVDEQELLDAMALAMIASIPPKTPDTRRQSFADPNVFVLGMASREPLDSSSNRTVWKKDRRMAIYHNKDGKAQQSTSANDPLKVYLAQTQADPSILRTPEAGKFFAREIGSRLFDLLIKDGSELDISVPLEDLGLDSLVAIELRAWCRQAFGVDVSVLEMLSVENLDMLGALMAKKLLQTVVGKGEKE
ncbi:hypothetical protein PRZ48_009271 [Zasmidium cellare]|uniref:Polyketide synthase n=1 Tax=Zasmidium cellare TaxID=395010 RepID=A0ABR0EBY3_ZASCE|nr:hypothetical protein PRZ48_009271 [Zasmidium cellare]